MKTYIKTTLTILISGMLFSSCEDQLNQANPNQATEDTFWKDETDFNLALTSCYTPLKNALNGGHGMILTVIPVQNPTVILKMVLICVSAVFN